MNSSSSVDLNMNYFSFALFRLESSVQKRWRDLVSEVKNRPRRASMTGGGPPDQKAPYEDIILQIMSGSCVIDGIGVYILIAVSVQMKWYQLIVQPTRIHK
eukprot:TRINITY_DN12031_c0_g1_i14.p1 TRINITY_DN12031_c0_g1~~TRINITY_DN12031_c0_g1_i14.p1  ORF type:complete len:101 (-),score=7.24 TRINITY_DN12031_c0_g1_i14:60-362(-)